MRKIAMVIGILSVLATNANAGVNLTSFLGPASRFSPIVLGLIGGALINSENND